MIMPPKNLCVFCKAPAIDLNIDNEPVCLKHKNLNRKDNLIQYGFPLSKKELKAGLQEEIEELKSATTSGLPSELADVYGYLNALKMPVDNDILRKALAFKILNRKSAYPYSIPGYRKPNKYGINYDVKAEDRALNKLVPKNIREELRNLLLSKII